ncbi:MAG: NAD(+)/NADH kinase [Magnetococcales bacterium]|nr:NAD(+)/NADH kinase [Magnetococcales bacterium]
MKNIGIITKRSDPMALEASAQLASWLHENGLKVTVSIETARDAGIDRDIASGVPQSKIPVDCDLVVVIGGDGTFIAATRAVGDRNTPLMGVNVGRLGFLTEVAMDQMISTLSQILSGRYNEEYRTLLDVAVVRNGEQVLKTRVLNDAVVHKEALARMMECNVAIDDVFAFSTRSDGLILSTPTGSTAYALSAGGPIIHPALDAILLVPICPHTLANRPIAVPGNGCVTVTLAHDGLDRLLTLDGQAGFALFDGDKVLVRQSRHKLRVLHAEDRDYFSVLRDKLHWWENPAYRRHT